ncbi:hypothetical protein [Bradyrhizobium sp. JYMT SZCCT0428]|uniref:hypothetical protein n=1 Tax=Bradyrhizobium sp. JYMT SZCCT0428 TaxID=2807673 RepID=UPI001BA45B06|nr:hypothetical protein [Bradyrhizobium sp. JYMT SZCCT0428]MBR1151200.1 hypothetical protein [Bradyrhizobium sp. JYMT SZCCT0428]
MEILIFAVLLGLIPAFLAKKKGRSFGLWWFYGACIFIVALPHALLMEPLPDSEEAMRLDSLQKTSKGFTPVKQAAIDFTADGVVDGIPFRNEPDGGVVSLIDGRTIKFRNKKDLEAMIRSQRRG